MILQLYHRKRILISLVIALLTLIILEIWSVNRLATFGADLSKIEQARQDLTIENQILEDQIAKASSLQEVSKDAQVIGFGNFSNFSYLNLPSLALKH